MGKSFVEGTSRYEIGLWVKYLSMLRQLLSMARNGNIQL